MTYELAAKLQKAGFPIVERADRAPQEHTYRVGIPGDLGPFYVPSLEELIDFSEGSAIVEELYETYTAKALQKLQTKKIN